jgi:tRNA/tmRNA/rRNA uracil-C5-methylase (TrmA/RlmC/RlmD family)
MGIALTHRDLWKPHLNFLVDEIAAIGVGAKLTLQIDDIAFGGEGIGRLGDFVVFVPFVAPGEKVEVELTEVKKRFARGRLIKVLEASAERVTPPCPYYGECGGCQYQHLAYPAQLRLKHKQVSDHFQRIGGFRGTLIDPVVPCPQPYGYRNRIMIRSQWDKFKRGWNIGFIRAENGLGVDIKEGKVAKPA